MRDLESSENSNGWGMNSINWIIFVFVLIVVFVSLISVVFPAYIASNNSTVNQLRELGISLVEINPNEFGVWAVPLFVANFLVFVTTLLYFKKKLPNFLTTSINFIFNFEVSKKITFLTIVILLSFYIVASFEELLVEEEWEDYAGVKQRLENWSPEQVTTGFEPHVKYFLHWASMSLFGYYTIVPFIASISLLILIYFFTMEITKKRFAGLIAFIVLLQSNVFLTYDTTVAYSNFWILFYLLSLFLVYKFWPLSPVSYLLSISSKALTGMFLPMSLFFIFRSQISKKRKIILVSTTSGIIFGGLLLVFVFNVNLSGGAGEQEEFDVDEFLLGFTSFSYQLRFDILILLFILPLVFGLFIASSYRIVHADSLMVLIGGMLLTAPFLTGFTELSNQPYRFVPLVVFFAIGVGVLLSKNKLPEAK